MSWDVYSYGMVAASTLYMLDGKFPEADAYAEIQSVYRMTGGEAANSSIVLGKLGVSTKLDGNWLGGDEDGRQTRMILDSFGIDTSRLTLKENYKGVLEVVFADPQTRTIFGSYCHLLFTDKQWNDPVEEDIRSSKIVCLDPFFKEESRQVAHCCRKHAKPYVTVDCAPDSDLARRAAVNIISGEYRQREYKDVPLEDVHRLYASQAEGLVVMTAGDREIVYGKNGEDPRRFTPYKVKSVDTAGAGDSFRSGIIYGMLRNWPIEKTVNFASALAACICASFPGVLNCPDLAVVLKFIEESGREF